MDILDRIVEQNLGVYRASPTRLREDVQQESQTTSDYRGRLAYELLQNADDAMEGEATQRDHVKFLLTDDALWMANNGRPLSDDDVQGLCGLGASSKIDAGGHRRASIGHKGLGFKSVLEITDQPAAMSEGIAFELSREIASRHVAPAFESMGIPVPASLPVMRFPQSLRDEPPEWSTLREQQFTTAFRFPFKDGLELGRREQLIENLLNLTLTTVLFLKHLDLVEVEIRTHERNESKAWAVTRERLVGDQWMSTPGLTESGMYRVEVSSADGDSAKFLVAHDAGVEIGDYRSGLTGPAWLGVTLSEVSIAVLEPASSQEEMPGNWRRFHVFLPTGERSPYPILVNGAFVTDLSRQAVRVNEEDPLDYNHHLIRRAASLFADDVLPVLADDGMDRVVGTLDRDATLSVGAAGAFHRAMAAEVSRIPLLPTTDGGSLALADAVFPPSRLGDQGSEYRRLLLPNAAWDGRMFPSPLVCTRRWSTVGADHGAVALDLPTAVSALAGLLNPSAAVADEHESGGFELDPVLEICAAIFSSADKEDQFEIQKRARSERLFPTFLNPDRTFDRVSLEGRTAFYPPRSAKHHLPLAGLEFMSHAICWGALLPKERTEVLGERLNVWTVLFDVQEFRFEVVMREAVLPHLRLRGRDQGGDVQSDLANMETLAAICQLAGRFPKPDRPLRYQRLETDRALFNLSRLPVPCRGMEADAVRWLPAYRVYFGKDWIGEASAENLVDALESVSAKQTLDLPFLLPPDEFLGRLEGATEDEPPDPELDEDEDEVDLDEDFDKTLESDERSAWVAFLKWIGVNEVLRPVHFHDVEELESGWLTTRDLVKPKGWAFARAGKSWDHFRSALIAANPRLSEDDTVPYFYELHDLEGLVSLLGAAERDSTGEIGRALLGHLTRHWETLDAFSEATLALVKKGLYPSQRSKPPKAKTEELYHAGDNFWIHRLKTHSHFPTSHGPRQPSQSWLMSDDIQRRFGRRGQTAEAMIPVFEFDGGLPQRQIAQVATRLGVRSSLTPATFTLDDARLLCRRLAELFREVRISEPHLRDIIKPAYRDLFELLAGRSSNPDNHRKLADEPLLVELNGVFSFEPAHSVLYSSTPGFIQRSGLRNLVATFVLEAEPSASAPLSALFGARALEDSVDWRPDPGESPFDEVDESVFRAGLNELAPAILARVRVERTRSEDRLILADFLNRVEAVEELDLTGHLNGRAYSLSSTREHYVRRSGTSQITQAFIVWNGTPWPPDPDEAQRLSMALADALQINLVEAFLALVQSEESQQRRLLEIAGASRFVEEARAELEAPAPGPIDDSSPTPARSVSRNPLDDPTEEIPAVLDDTVPAAAAPVELVRFEDLWIGGAPMLIRGEDAYEEEPRASTDRTSSKGSASGSRAALGTDLVSLDGLGMRIATAYEINRLNKRGVEDATVFPADEPRSGLLSFVVDMSTPGAISRAKAQSNLVDSVLESLQEIGVSQIHPGFDLLTVVDGEVDRMIELKSSTVEARVQAMTWNEWKAARNSGIRSKFWLYLVGNLRADISAPPYLRAIRDPFGSLYAEETSAQVVSRAVQLRVREFEEAEHLYLVRELEQGPAN